MESFKHLWYDTENVVTRTASEQCNCERECSNFLKDFICYDAAAIRNFRSGGLINAENEIRLLKAKHAQYLEGFLSHLPGGFVTLEASRPWIIYWILHALYLLGREPLALYPRIIRTLQSMQNSAGGFGGGMGHISQGAPNYAAVLSLCTIGTKEAFDVIDRPAMYNYFLSMKQPNGAFTIHKDGEMDSRSTYTVICIARILNILTDQLIEGTADYLLKCQTYEGGFGGEPGNEAHGGYNFCALAALLILKQTHKCDLVALESWLLRRQSKFEGGFHGRTNKLVDSCYSFWQGAAVAMVQIAKLGGSDTYDMDKFFEHQQLFAAEELSDDVDEIVGGSAEDHMKEASDNGGNLQFNQKALQKYILHCGQSVEYGGMRDKPGKSRDFYHTCYSLSGLSIAQRSIVSELKHPNDNSSTMPNSEEDEEFEVAADTRFDGFQIYGDIGNLLAPTSVVFNIGLPQLKSALEHFAALPNSHEVLVRSYAERLESR